MRKAIKELIKKSFILEYTLPNGVIDKTTLTKFNDYCFDSTDSKVSESIYNSIIDYCLNDIEVDLLNLDKNQLFSIENRLRYDSDADLDIQLKYGFFGETLLNIFLKVFFHTEKIIAKGHFYNPLERSEPKGYDSFHFIENDLGLEFWFGESKMYTSLKGAVKSILSNLNNALSNEYYERNIRAIMNRNSDLDETKCSLLFKELLEKLKNENMEEVMSALVKNGVKMVYPILIIYNESSDNFDMKIKSTMTIIQNEIDKQTIDNQINAELLFVLVPVTDVISIKKEVLEWISIQKPVI